MQPPAEFDPQMLLAIVHVWLRREPGALSIGAAERRIVQIPRWHPGPTDHRMLPPNFPGFAETWTTGDLPIPVLGESNPQPVGRQMNRNALNWAAMRVDFNYEILAWPKSYFEGTRHVDSRDGASHGRQDRAVSLLWLFPGVL